MVIDNVTFCILKELAPEGFLLIVWSRDVVNYPLGSPLGFLHPYIRRLGLDVLCLCNIQSRRLGFCDEL